MMPRYVWRASLRKCDVCGDPVVIRNDSGDFCGQHYHLYPQTYNPGDELRHVEERLDLLRENVELSRQVDELKRIGHHAA